MLYFARVYGSRNRSLAASGQVQLFGQGNDCLKVTYFVSRKQIVDYLRFDDTPKLCWLMHGELPFGADVKELHSQSTAGGWRVHSISDSPYRRQRSAAT
jgi:hypothetical protein